MIVNDSFIVDDSPWSGKLPTYRLPRHMHFVKDDAENEILRLKAEHPGESFTLLEAIAVAKECPPGCFRIEAIEGDT